MNFKPEEIFLLTCHSSLLICSANVLYKIFKKIKKIKNPKKNLSYNIISIYILYMLGGLILFSSAWETLEMQSVITK